MNASVLILLLSFAVDVAALNGANDAPVIAPGRDVAPTFAPPPPPVPVTTGAPTGAPALPIDTPPTANPNAPPAADSDSPASKIMPLLQGLGGMGGGGGAGSGTGGSSGDGRGGDRAAGGDGGGGPPVGGTSSAIQYDGGGETLRGGQTIKSIAGCSAERGKFQFIYGHSGACSPGRDGKLKMSDTLASFMDRNLNRCVSEAAGMSNVTGGRFYHAGTIGDARHQQTGSLHNAGLAIDLNAIAVGNTMYSYKNKDATTRGFFNKFRKCWGTAANGERLGCLGTGRRGPPGTIGEEDSDHRNHLHLSVPLCPAEARAKGLYLALRSAWRLFVPTVAARELAAVTRRSVVVPGGKVELSIRDQHGEPVDADQRFTLSANCDGQKSARKLLADEGGCEFVAFKARGSDVELRYLKSAMVEGELICRVLVIKTIRPGCASK